MIKLYLKVDPESLLNLGYVADALLERLGERWNEKSDAF